MLAKSNFGVNLFYFINSSLKDGNVCTNYHSYYVVVFVEFVHSLTLRNEIEFSSTRAKFNGDLIGGQCRSTSERTLDFQRLW